MIFDCFTFCGERSLLKLRCEEFKLLEPLKKFMPYTHIAVEGKYTFTGIEKKMSMKMGDIQNYQIDWTPYTERPVEDPWENERRLRNHLLVALQQHRPKDDDIVIISDIDEIPRAYAIQHYRPEFGLVAFQMDVHHFFLNTQESHQTWRAARIMPYGYLKTTTPDKARNSGFNLALVNGGWHFTYQGGIDTIMAKFKSFSHQEEEVQKLANRDDLQLKIDTLTSLWGDKVMKLVPIHELPFYLQQHTNEFSHMLCSRPA